MTKVSEVFVAGGQPTYTYNPRTRLGLERSIQDYLDRRHKILAVSGPTKSGKTVLVRRVIPKQDAFWVTGGEIGQSDDLWQRILSQADQPAETTESYTSSATDQIAGEIKTKAPGLSLKGTASNSSGTSTTRQATRKPSTQSRAIKVLQDTQRPLVIDDFHYIDRNLQRTIIRALKDPVFDGLPVVLISVPHRLYDAIAAEKEMTGRVQPLAIPKWSPSELAEIGSNGFSELRMIVSGDDISKMADNSFASPHLMQDFCAGFCAESNVKSSYKSPTLIETAIDWSLFFQKHAQGAAKPTFEKLARGPRQRRDRKKRPLACGGTVDIYGAVLRAIASTGPKDELSYEEIRASVRTVLASSVPQGQEVGAVLERMSDIAKDSESEPVMEWVKKESTLYITDPFFLFFLRWGLLARP